MATTNRKTTTAKPAPAKGAGTPVSEPKSTEPGTPTNPAPAETVETAAGTPATPATTGTVETGAGPTAPGNVPAHLLGEPLPPAPVPTDPRPAEPAGTLNAYTTPLPATRTIAAEPVAVGAPHPASTADPNVPAGPDAAALRRLAALHGNDPVTPYPGGIPAPNPTVPALPQGRHLTWMPDDTAEPATITVLIDGWRVRIGNGYYFATKGETVTLPRDIAEKAAARGTVRLHPTEEDTTDG